MIRVVALPRINTSLRSAVGGPDGANLAPLTGSASQQTRSNACWSLEERNKNANIYTLVYREVEPPVLVPSMVTSQETRRGVLKAL